MEAGELQIQGQPGIHSKSLSQKKKKEQKRVLGNTPLYTPTNSRTTE
jgi:hypothetical protein